MDTIGDLLSRDLTRRIEEVIQVHQAEEQSVYAEVTEYVATSSIRDQYATLLPVIARVLGPEHPATLDARDGLAYWTGEAGDPAGSRDQYAALLPIRERISGPEHPATLDARGALAYWDREARRRHKK